MAVIIPTYVGGCSRVVSDSITVTAWFDGISSAYSIEDTASGSLLVAETQLAAVATSVPIVVLTGRGDSDERFTIIWCDGVDLNAKIINPASEDLILSSSIATSTWATAVDAEGKGLDAVAALERVVFVARTGVGTATVGAFIPGTEAFSGNTLALSAKDGSLATTMPLSLSVNGAGALVCVLYYSAAGHLDRTIFNYTTLISSGTATVASSIEPTQMTARWNEDDNLDIVYEQYGYTIKRALDLDPTSGAGTIATIVERGQLASHVTVVEGRKVVFMEFANVDSDQRYILVYDVETSALVGRHLVQAGAGAIGLGKPNLVRASTLGTKSKFALMGVVPAYGEYQITEVEYDPYGVAAHQTVEHNGLLFLSGPLTSHFDGHIVKEHGFTTYPDDVSTAIQVGGNLEASAAYSYKIFYERTNRLNQREFSTTGPTVNVTTTGTDKSFEITFPELTHGRTDDVLAVVYRTLGDGSLFYRLTYVELASGGGTVTITDNSTDSGISDNELLTDAEIDNVAIPATRFIASGLGRLFYITAADPTRLYYTKLQDEDLAVEAQESLYIQFDEELTGCGFMSGQIAVFGKNRIWQVAGEGPDNTGIGSFSEPVRAENSVGLVNPKSLLETPVGYLFESNRGIWLLSPRFQASYVGSNVKDYEAQDITAATALPDVNQVRLLCSSGKTLLWDYETNRWGLFTGVNGVGAAVWNGDYCYLDSTGNVYREDQTLYLDDDEQVLTGLTTSWLRPSQELQGQTRTRRFHLLGHELSPTLLKVEVGYSYEEEFTTTYYVRSSDLPSVRLRLKRQKASAYRFRITEVNQGNNGAGISLVAISLEVMLLGGGSRTDRDGR